LHFALKFILKNLYETNIDSLLQKYFNNQLIIISFQQEKMAFRYSL